MNWFKAKFPFTCDNCGERGEEGDWCCYDADKQMLCKPCGKEIEDE